MAETIKSASILFSVPLTGLGTLSSISHSATMIAVARLLSSFSILTGITPFKIVTPSCMASFTSCSAAVMSSFLNKDVKVTSAPSFTACSETSWAT